MNYYDPEAWEAHEARMAGPEEDDDDDVETCQGCGDSAVGLGIDSNELCGACRDNDAAMSCEGDDDMEGRDFHPDAQDPGFPWESRLALLLDEASDLQLKQAGYAVERKQRQRLEQAQATLRTLDPNAKPLRATRKDKGTHRAPKAAEVPA